MLKIKYFADNTARKCIDIITEETGISRRDYMRSTQAFQDDEAVKASMIGTIYLLLGPDIARRFAKMCVLNGCTNMFTAIGSRLVMLLKGEADPNVRHDRYYTYSSDEIKALINSENKRVFDK